MARGQHQRASPQQMRTHPPGSEPRAWKTGSRLRSGPLICPPFCHVCRASGQQCVSLAICKGGAAAGGGSVRKRAMCKRQASPQTADCLSSLEPGFSSLYRAKLVEPGARLDLEGAGSRFRARRMVLLLPTARPAKRYSAYFILASSSENRKHVGG